MGLIGIMMGLGVKIDLLNNLWIMGVRKIKEPRLTMRPMGQTHSLGVDIGAKNYLWS